MHTWRRDHEQLITIRIAGNTKLWPIAVPTFQIGNFSGLLFRWTRVNSDLSYRPFDSLDRTIHNPDEVRGIIQAVLRLSIDNKLIAIRPRFNANTVRHHLF